MRGTIVVSVPTYRLHSPRVFDRQNKLMFTTQSSDPKGSAIKMSFTHSIAFKLTLLVLGLTSTILGAVILYSYFYSGKIILAESENDARTLAFSVARRIEQEFRAAAKVPEQLARFLEIDPPNDSSTLLKLVQTVAADNQEVYGSTVAYEPYAFDPSRRLFAPYFFRGRHGLQYVQLGSKAYDYLKKDWYHVPAQTRAPMWSQPYFDEGGGNAVMVTYSVPFFELSEEGSRNKLRGVVTSDLSLEWLTELIAATRVGRGGHCFIISDTGTFVTHARPELIMRESIFSLASEYGDSGLREIGRTMLRESSGFLDLGTNLTGEDSFLAFARIPSIGWSLAAVFPKKDLFADLNALHTMELVLSIAGVMALLASSIIVAKSMSGPLRRMVAATDQVAQGNLDVDLTHVARNDEIGVLAEAFTRMAADLKKFIRELTETTAAKERIESELAVGRDIQRSMVPSKFPAFPDRSEFEIYAAMEPARQVGGDFYDFFLVDKDHLCLAIGDVSGKGVPAALFMAVTRFLVRNLAREKLGPAELLDRLNSELATDNEACMFVTIFLAVLDMKTGELVYSSGGHEPTMLLHNNAQIDLLRAPGGPVVGLMEHVSFETDRVVLTPGDLLFAYTDGVTEAVDIAGDYFSRKRLQDALLTSGAKTAQHVIEAVSEVLIAFSRGAPQADDITMMALKFDGPRGKGSEQDRSV